MFDYKKWIEDAKYFTDRITRFEDDFAEVKGATSAYSTLDELEIKEATQGIDKFIPLELQHFWKHAAQSCDFYYVCRDARGEMVGKVESIFGSNGVFYSSLRFFSPLQLKSEIFVCREWAENFLDDSEPEQAEIWFNALPFQMIDNGDYLSLDISNELDDPPVVYLAHDDNSQIIASSFTSFLHDWAEICYIGPESWMLKPFQNANGLIDASSQQAVLLRQMLQSS